MVGLVALATSSCNAQQRKDQAARTEPAPAEAPQGKATDDDSPASSAGATTPTKDPDKRTGGLSGLTRDFIAEAKRATVEPLRLVPNTATILGQLRPGPMLAYGPAADLWDRLEREQGDVRTAMDVVRACMGKADAIEDIVLGMDDDDHAILAMRGKGLGTEQLWECFGTEARSRGGDWNVVFTGKPRGEGPQLSSDDDPGYFIDDDTVVIVSKEWDVDFAALRRGETKPAIDDRLAPMAGRIGTDRTFWVLGEVTTSLAIGFVALGMDGAEDFALSIDIEDDTAVLDGSTTFASEGAANGVKDKLQKQFDEIESVLPMLGAPATVGPKIQFEHEGDEVRLGFALTRDEIEGIRRGLESML